MNREVTRTVNTPPTYTYIYPQTKQKQTTEDYQRPEFHAYAANCHQKQADRKMLPKLSQSVSDSLHPYSTYRNFELVHTVYVVCQLRLVSVPSY